MPIAIVGAGVVGLSTAVVLARRGHCVTVYAKDLPPNVSSHAACAIWLPFVMGETASGAEVAAQNEARRWAEVSWAHFAKLEDRDCGVRRVRLREVFRKRPRTPYYSDIVEDFSEGSFRSGVDGYSYAWELETFVIEMPTYLPWLADECRRLDVEIVERELAPDDLVTLDEPVVVNCSGLGARELAGDDGMVPIKGQLLLHDPLPSNVALGADRFCIIPRSDALVIGSMLIEDEEGVEEDLAASDWLWSTATAWAGTQQGHDMGIDGVLDRAKVRETVVGVRPYRRRGVRLEREQVDDRAIYHNYGHGGGGVTVSWGCATALVDLYETTVEQRYEDACAVRTGAKCDVSIEVGHVEPDRLPRDPNAIREMIAESVKQAGSLIRTLAENGRSYNVVALVDDKSFQPRRRREIVEHLDSFADWLGVDYVCSESRLVERLEDALPLLDSTTRAEVSHWKGGHGGTLACSHDIVLWYMLRLGLISPSDVVTPVSQGAQGGKRPFQAHRLVSILGSRTFEQPERRAARILRRSFGAEMASACGVAFYDSVGAD